MYNNAEDNQRFKNLLIHKVWMTDKEMKNIFPHIFVDLILVIITGFVVYLIKNTTWLSNLVYWNLKSNFLSFIKNMLTGYTY